MVEELQIDHIFAAGIAAELVTLDIQALDATWEAQERYRDQYKLAECARLLGFSRASWSLALRSEMSTLRNVTKAVPASGKLTEGVTYRTPEQHRAVRAADKSWSIALERSGVLSLDKQSIGRREAASDPVKIAAKEEKKVDMEKAKAIVAAEKAAPAPAVSVIVKARTGGEALKALEAIVSAIYSIANDQLPDEMRMAILEIGREVHAKAKVACVIEAPAEPVESPEAIAQRVADKQAIIDAYNNALMVQATPVAPTMHFEGVAAV